MVSNPLQSESILNGIWKFSSLLTEKVTVVFNYVNLDNDLQQSCFVSFENKVEISVKSAKFCIFNLLKPTAYVMHQQFNIQQFYALPTLYLCVLYLSETKQRLVPLT